MMVQVVRIHRTRPGWRVFIPRTCLSVSLMGGRRIARRAASSRRIGRIIVGRWIDVCERWTITVLGEWPIHSRDLSDDGGSVVWSRRPRSSSSFSSSCIRCCIASLFWSFQRSIRPSSEERYVTSTMIDRADRQTGKVNPHWAVTIGLYGISSMNFPSNNSRSAFFGLFAFGMTITTFQLVVHNLTTIENLSRSSVVWTLAIRVPDYLVNNPESEWAPTYPTITYPLQPPPTGPEAQGKVPATGKRHTFAILQTQPGENPFDLDSWVQNMQQILGFSPWEWLLPFTQSPCVDHSSHESAFALGPVVTNLRREAGLEPSTQEGFSQRRHRHKRRKSRS